MATHIVNEIQVELESKPVPDEEERIGCSIGIMAYNEEANIGRTLQSVLAQTGPSISINEVIVVASGCTDRTVPIVTEMATQEPRIHLFVQEKREGKASAINLFLKQATSPVAVLIGADVIPETSAIEYLCAPFQDATIGMVGGRPVPVNDPNTFMGHAVHLLWRLHDGVARIHPKLGEVIAFRNVISGIPTDSAVDEISIQALISQLGFRLIYRPECIVYNKGPLTVRDFLKQRRRIYAGHLKVLRQQNYEASTMKVSPIFRQLISARHYALSTPRQVMWTFGAMVLEGYARIQGHYDYRRKREHYIWQA
ncbi:MAG: glycosyltransferase, partial [Ktedonobacteraceae bacterium]